ncbi:MAG: hypothetical protein OEZ13_12245 [Spirochaetia bacterium]|nr:hypothetical protein [Spirochaetia bacterium]
MKIKLQKYITFFLILNSFGLYAQSNTVIDFDIAEGRKKLEGIESYSSFLEFKNTYRDIKAYYSSFEIEERERENKIAYLKIMNEGEILHEFSDFDLNGKFETWKKYKNGLVASQFKLDEKEKIIIEETVFNENGTIAQVKIDEKKSGYFTEVNIYKTGKIVKTMKDLNGDGLFEEVYYYEIDPDLSAEEKKIFMQVKKISTKDKIYYAGFYSVKENAKMQEDLTNAVFEMVKGFCINKKEDIASYKEMLERKEENGERSDSFINRFEFFNAVLAHHKIKLEKGGEKIYVLSGNLFIKAGKLSLYFRLVGPQPLKTAFSGSIIIAEKDFNEQLAATRIYEELKKFIVLGDEMAKSQ